MNTFVKDLVLLNMIEGIGPIKLKLLLDEFKEPGNILRASFDRLKNVQGIGNAIAQAVSKARSTCDINKEIDLIKNKGVDVLTLFEDGYPENLKNIYDPPIILYVKGKIKKKDDLAVSIVGSRKCTYYGMNMANQIAGQLAENHVTIISGLARGIDTSAHKGALKTSGRTIAVLGNGLMSVYPAENKDLAEKIAQNGAVISEFPMRMTPRRQNFPRRNRIISGLSKAVLVVEATSKSGALITVDFALEQGRDVFAVPGMADRLSSMGTNSLIKQGAKLVENAGDILEELEKIGTAL